MKQLRAVNVWSLILLLVALWVVIRLAIYLPQYISTSRELVTQLGSEIPWDVRFWLSIPDVLMHVVAGLIVTALLVKEWVLKSDLTALITNAGTTVIALAMVFLVNLSFSSHLARIIEQLSK